MLARGANPQTIENEHRVQFGMFNALREAISAAREKERLESLFGQLLEHSNVHFMSEQLLMPLHDYPEYEARCGQTVRESCNRVCGGLTRSVTNSKGR